MVFLGLALPMAFMGCDRRNNDYARYEQQAWDGWTARSRQFIQSQPERIRLYALVEIYLNKTKTLHEWLVKSFETYYGSTIKEFDALHERLHKQ